MYDGKNVESERKHRAWTFPLVFFYRRMIFCVGTVLLFDKPALQMILHQILSLGMLAYLFSDHYMFANRMHWFCEFGTEALLLLVSILMQQYMSGGEEVHGMKLKEIIFIEICLMFAINLAYLVFCGIKNFIQKRQIKQARKQSQKHKASRGEKAQAKAERDEVQRPSNPQADVKILAAVNAES